MWRWKAVAVGILWLTAGCAAVRDQRTNQAGDVEARAVSEVRLEGCLSKGTEPGTFVLMTSEPDGGESGRAVKVMSTRIGLSAHVGRRVAVSGREQATPSRSIHDGATLFQIRLLEVLDSACGGRSG